MSPTNSNNPATKASDSASASGDADLAQAYRDLARGEHAATALENNLSNLESRLDAILAALEAKEDPRLPATAIASKPEDSSKVEGTDDSKDEPQDGTTGDAVKAGKDTA